MNLQLFPGDRAADRAILRSGPPQADRTGHIELTDTYFNKTTLLTTLFVCILHKTGISGLWAGHRLVSTTKTVHHWTWNKVCFLVDSPFQRQGVCLQNKISLCLCISCCFFSCLCQAICLLAVEIYSMYATTPSGT